MPAFIIRAAFAYRLPRAAIPQHDRAATVLSLRDDAFEAAVLERMILHMYGQAAVGGIQARALGDGPAFQHTIQFEAKIVVEATRRVLLDHEAVAVSLVGCRPRRLRRSLEVPFCGVGVECVGGPATGIGRFPLVGPPAVSSLRLGRFRRTRGHQPPTTSPPFGWRTCPVI